MDHATTFCLLLAAVGLFLGLAVMQYSKRDWFWMTVDLAFVGWFIGLAVTSW